MSQTINMVGKRFNMWEVLESVEAVSRSGKKYWVCKCDCGTVRAVEGKSLRNGTSKNCGCIRKITAAKASAAANKKHGMKNTRLYNIWRGMKGRIHCSKTKSYERYGGRGITICDEWENSFIAFKDWALSNGYDKALTLDRINVDGNYEPANCRWATWSEQAQNRKKKERR